MVAMGERDAGRGRAAERRRDARHDLDGDAAALQIRQLLAAAAEDEGIAALEAHDAAAGLRLPGDQRVDLVLALAVVALALADIDPLGVAAREIEHARPDQLVVDHHVGALDQPQRAQRQQIGIARPGADDGDSAARRRGRGAAVDQGQHPLARAGNRCRPAPGRPRDHRRSGPRSAAGSPRSAPSPSPPRGSYRRNSRAGRGAKAAAVRSPRAGGWPARAQRRRWRCRSRRDRARRWPAR